MTAAVSAPETTRATSAYVPALDGMRAIAVLIVVFSHFGLHVVFPGGFGVTLFFFISGLLITRLLIAEFNSHQRIAIGAFYVRRFLRLGPALAVNIAVVCGIYALLGEPVGKWEVAAAVFYFMNYYYVAIRDLTAPLGILWSLAVEEHYYAFYPLIFSLAWVRPLRFLRWLLIVSAAVLLWRLVCGYAWPDTLWQNYYRTDTRIDSILYGAVLACMLELPRFDDLLRRIGDTAGFAIAIVILLVTFVYRDAFFRETIRYSLQGIALIPVFYAILFNARFGWLRHMLEHPLMTWIGRLSYSLYLWNEVVLSLAPKLLPMQSFWGHYGLGLLLCFLVAALSYYGVERPFMSLRRAFRRDGSTERPAPDAVDAGGPTTLASTPQQAR
ncbi:MAG: acyltransferase [Pseudomonadota bacterium]